MKLTMNAENRRPLVDLISRFTGEDADLRLPDWKLYGDTRGEFGGAG